MNNSVYLLGYVGAYRDPVLGSYLLGNGYRWYLPDSKRFNAPDDDWSPFGAGGINPYAYCAGDPVNQIDPSGHAPIGLMEWADELAAKITRKAWRVATFKSIPVRFTEDVNVEPEIQSAKRARISSDSSSPRMPAFMKRYVGLTPEEVEATNRLLTPEESLADAKDYLDQAQTHLATAQAGNPYSRKSFDVAGKPIPEGERVTDKVIDSGRRKVGKQLTKGGDAVGWALGSLHDARVGEDDPLWGEHQRILVRASELKSEVDKMKPPLSPIEFSFDF